MSELSSRNFGMFIAYVLPGFTALWGVGRVVPGVDAWLNGPVGGSPSVGGVLYATLASVAAGMTVSVIRWAVIDTLHRMTGLRRPRWNDAQLPDRLAAFEALVENHYRYYQFYSNTLIAAGFAYAAWRWTGEFRGGWTDAVFLAIEGIYFAGSRDALRRYYTRSAALLGERERKVDHDQRTRTRTRTGARRQRQPRAAARSRLRSANAAARPAESADTEATAGGAAPGLAETTSPHPVVSGPDEG